MIFSRGGVKVFAFGGVFQTREEDTIREGFLGSSPGKKCRFDKYLSEFCRKNQEKSRNVQKMHRIYVLTL